MLVTLLLVLKLLDFSANFFIIFSNVLLWIFLSLTKERENGIFVVIEKVKCAKYSFNLTYNQESDKTLSLKYIHFPLWSFYAFVCLFVFFLQSLKIMRPCPVCFSSWRKHPWASIYFLKLVYPFHTTLAYS